MSEDDDLYVITSGTRLARGGSGFDILDFGDAQGVTTVVYNGLDGSGGTLALFAPATGERFSIDYADFEGFQGSRYDDQITGNAQTRHIAGGGGNDTLAAQVMDTPYSITIFGGEGDDSAAGSEVNDVINGNQGADVVHGWDGEDWVYGGQGDDVLFGDAGNDNANGNLGDDTVDGGAGGDTLRGGQGADLVLGGAGADLLFGDLGSDTLTGGDGADVFVVALNTFTGPFNGAPEVITDFSFSEGDRIRIDGDVSWRTEQSGADARLIISYGSDETYATFVVLKNVTLPAGEGWLIY